MNSTIEHRLNEVLRTQFIILETLQLMVRRQSRADKVLVNVAKMERYEMSQLDDLLALVGEQGTVVASAITLLDELKAKIDAAGTDPAKLAEISTLLSTQKDALAAAIVKDTIAASEVPVV